MRLERCLLTLSLLALPAPAGAGSLELERLANGAVRLTLPGELGRSWREVNVGRLVLRTPGGVTSPTGRSLPGAPHLKLEAPRGCALLQVDLGPPATRSRSDAWWRVTRCSKIVVCYPSGRAARNRAARREIGPVVTAKTGSRIEIRPLFNPLLLVPGSDLPVRLYFDGQAVSGARLSAHGPGGMETEAWSDEVGIANLTLAAPGPWTLRYEHRGAVAELVFESGEG